MRWFYNSGLILLVIIFSFACGTKKEEKKIATEALVNQKCSICHDTERIYKTPRKAEEWKGVIERMHRINPQLLSRKDAAQICEYLQETLSK